MKHIIASFSLILVIFVAGIVNSNIAGSRLSNIIDMLGMSDEYVDKGDWETAERFASRAKLEWDGLQTYLSIISRHSELDEINATVNRTMESLLCQDYTLYKTESSVLVGMIEHIYEMEQLSIKNIL